MSFENLHDDDQPIRRMPRSSGMSGCALFSIISLLVLILAAVIGLGVVMYLPSQKASVIATTRTTPPTQNEQKTAMASVLESKWRNFQREYDEIQRSAKEDKSPSSDTAEILAHNDRINAKYAALSVAADDLLLALDRYERAGGLRPDGQTIIELCNKAKAFAAMVAAKTAENRRILESLDK